jgi:hypothetical protein
MASVDRRIEELERSFAESPQFGGGGGGYVAALSKRFVVDSLNAMAHIRRAPLDGPIWRYDVEKLRGRGTFSAAVYVAALRVLEHPDEAEAFDIFVEKRDPRDAVPFEKLIDLVVAIAAQSRLRHQGEHL